jgi:hypothetical protein
MPARVTAAGWLTLMSCALALSGCTAAGPGHTAAPRHHAASPQVASLSFPQLEGVYRQPGRTFVVTYQGWWLDLESEQIRQLTPVAGGSFSYGPGWQDPAPVQGQLRFTTDAAGIPVR